MPYPGVYLDPAVDLKEHGVRALDGKYPEYRLTRRPEELVAEAEATARVKAGEFFACQRRWRETLGQAAAGTAPRGFLASFAP